MLCSCCGLVPTHRRLRLLICMDVVADSVLLVGLDVDKRLCPLARGHLALEQDVDLAVGSVLHLRQEEVGQQEAHETRSGPDVAALAAEVGLLWGC